MLDAAGTAPRLRRRADDELRGARPARLELGGARRARRRRHEAGRRRCSAGPTASAATSSTARKLGRALGESGAAAATAFAPSTCAFATRSRRRWASSSSRVHGLGARAARRRRQPRAAADGRRQRPRPARNALSSIGPPSSAPRGATVNSSAWNCCTNCATKRATTRSPPSPPRSAATRDDARAWLAADAAPTPRPAGRRRATEFDAPPASRSRRDAPAPIAAPARDRLPR